MKRARLWTLGASAVIAASAAIGACVTGSGAGPTGDMDAGGVGDGAIPGLDATTPDAADATTPDAADATTLDALAPDTSAPDVTTDSPADAGTDVAIDSPVDTGTDAADAGPPILALATGLGANLTSITVSGGNVFWIDTAAGTIQKCAITGCGTSPTTLVVDVRTPEYLAVDSQNVYFTDDTLDTGEVQSIPIDSDGGIAATPLATTQPDPEGIAIDATGLYWANYTFGGSLNNGAISRCDPTNCAATLTQTTGQTFARNISLDATNIYWVGEGNPGSTGFVRTAPKGALDGGYVSLASNQQNAELLAIDSTNIYFVVFVGADPTPVFCPLGGCGGGATPLTTTSINDQAGNVIVSDGANVYFVGYGGSTNLHLPDDGVHGRRNGLRDRSRAP